MIDPQHWFSEICEECGSAFSLRIEDKLHEERTPYQLIEVYATQRFGKLLVIDGFIMLSERENFLYHEMMAHPALFTHDNPAKVVIIGGGDCGTLREVLHHAEVREAWQIEIDERVTRVAEQFFPDLCAANADPRARFYFGDGIQWIRDAAADSIDVIIVDSTDPIGPAKGLFQEPFYAQCRRALRPGGLMVQQSESPLFHMRLLRDIHQDMQAAGFTDIATLQFPQAVYPSGWWTATLARKDATLGDFREQAVRDKSFPTRYYNAEIHRAAFAMPEFFRQELARRD